MRLVRSLFLYQKEDLESDIPGGVQRCTREYLALARQISEVDMFAVAVGRLLRNRVQRKFGLKPYALYDTEMYREGLRARIANTPIDVAFINRTELIRFVPLLAQLSPRSKIVLLSHGNESGDLLYEWSTRRPAKDVITQFRRARKFGELMIFEARLRHEQEFKVCVLTEEEAVLERWLGSCDVMVIPRTIEFDPVEWQPVANRVGFVGTLNHTPNLVALESICELLLRSNDKNDIEIEVVGGPVEIGRQLSARYPFVRYLGALQESACRDRAVGWSLFLNPIFWLSRGASMKLGQALSWGLPTLTTRSGRRGYIIPEGTVVECSDNREEFFRHMLRALADPGGLMRLRKELLQRRLDFPSRLGAAGLMRSWIVGRLET